MGLRARLLLLVLLTVIPAFFLALYTSLEQRRSGMLRVENDAIRVAQLAAAGQLGLIEATRQHLSGLSRLPQARGNDLKAFDSFFAGMLKIYADYTDFGLIETNGDLVSCSFGRQGPTNLAARAHLQRVLKTQDFAIGDYQAGDGTAKPSLPIGHPVFDEKGRLARVLYAALDLAVLNDVAAKAQLPEGGVITIFDSQGHILARHPEPQGWIGKSFAESPVMTTIMTKREGTAEMRGIDGEPRLYAFTSIRGGQDASLFVSVGIPTSLAFAATKRTLIRNLLILGGAGVLALLAARAYANSYILRPVSALANTTRRVTAGDLSARTGIDRAAGELNQLAQAFDEMAASLHRQRMENLRSENALRDSEERVRLVLDRAMDAVLTFDAKGIITSWNKEAERIFGWTREEICGQGVSTTIISPQYRQTLECDLERFRSTRRGEGLNKRIEIMALCQDRREFPVELAITPIELEDGILFSAFVRDITERKRTEEEIRRLTADLERRVIDRTAQLESTNLELIREITERAQAENELRKLRQELKDYVDSMSTLNAKVALDGRLLLINRIAQEALGLPAETLGKTYFLEGPWWAFDPEVQQRVGEAFQQACGGTPVNYDEKIFVFGRVTTINFSLVPVTGPDGQVAYVVAEGRDITPLKEAEEELRERSAQLEAANKELEAFSYSVSHDLRAPVRSISAFSRILVEDYGQGLDEEGKRLLGVIEGQSQRMGRLIDELLNFSRLGRGEMKSGALDMTAMAKAVFEELLAQQKEGKPQLELRALPPARGDEALMRQVFMNLLSNAIKFTRKREVARIEIGGESNSEQNLYYVKDNGAGFDPKYANKLFGVFQRLHRDEEFEGNGVGLALVQRIINRHGGRIWAEAKLNEGATFYFSLPK